MPVTYHKDLIQGSEEWAAQRCGLLTASEMKLIITPKKLEYAQTDKEKAHLYELAAQRITGYVEPQYISDDMLRGQDDESRARETYHEKYAPVETCGFITNDDLGFTLGYSPDGLVGDDGLIECKSRRQKFQMEVLSTGNIPDDYLIQIQTGMLVSGRKWLDFISYSGGMPMFVKRVLPDEKVQDGIKKVADIFHQKLINILNGYGDKIIGLIQTERVAREITI